MATGNAQYASIVYWDGIQQVPAPLKAIAAVTPIAGVLSIPLAKLTTMGAQGSLTFTDGVLTAYVKPT